MEDENLPLENSWCFWFDKGQKQKLGGGKDPYLERLKNLGQFKSVVDFWKHFNHYLVGDMRNGANLMLFKAGINPVWEDAGNVKGGKWVLPLAGCDVAWVWETCVLHAIGEQFSMSDSVCGVVLARRGEPRGDSLCLWNNDCTRREDIERMSGELRTILRLPATANVVYQPHKGHIDFGQQHPPPAKRRSSGRRSSKEHSPKDGSPALSARSSAAAPAASVAPLSTADSPAAPVAVPVAAAAAAPAAVPPVVVAAVAPRVVVTMDVEHTTTVLAVAAAPREEAADDDGAAALLLRGQKQQAAAAPTVLAVRRPRSPAPTAAEPVASEAAAGGPVTATTKKGRQRQKQEAEKAAADKAAAEAARKAQKKNKKSGAARAGSVSAAGKTDATLLAVAVVGVLVGVLSLVFMLR